jgi:hypothetical protein
VPLPGAAGGGGLLADPYLAMIERAARDQTIDLAKLEGLMALRERMEDRRAKQAFDNAIALAKGEIRPIVKNRAVDFSSQKGRTNYRYEDFSAIAGAVDPVLARHGLSYRFRSEQQGNKLRITCRISHQEGYGEDTSLEAANDESGNKNSIQAVGSTAVYLQRYTLKLALGLAASNDDDARSVGAPSEQIGPDEVAHIEQLLRDTESDLAAFLGAMKAPSVEEMTATQYKTALAMFERKKKQLSRQS